MSAIAGNVKGKIAVTQNDDDSQINGIEFPSCDYESFADACIAAADTGRKILLLDNATLSDPFCLRHHKHLEIEGFDPQDGTNDVTSVPQRTISGCVHSLFVLNNFSKLTLKNVTLRHTRVSDDHREVGAAVNLRKKAELKMENCYIVSLEGFCCWAVQKSAMDLDKCRLEARARSAVVCFGQPKCRMSDCTISDAGVHAVCARGPCTIHLDRCVLERSVVRALYAYADACVTLDDCHVTGTIRPDHAAVEVSALQSEERQNSNFIVSSLTMKNCRVVHNAGVGICLRGPVEHDMENNDVRDNGGADIELAAEMKETTGDFVAGQRDASGSSYRMGDWWCRSCIPRVTIMGSLSNCPHCNADISTGSLLTANEVLSCNRKEAPTSSLGNQNTGTGAPTWWYDGDSTDKGWVLYDEESSRILEDAFRRCAQEGGNLNGNETEDVGVVLVCGGKYEVNVITRVQTNVETQFPRLVRRIPS